MQELFNISKISVIYHINRLKKKNHMIGSTEAKSFGKIQHPFMIEMLRKPGREVALPQLSKEHLQKKSAANIKLNGERLTVFPWPSGTRQACLLLPLLLNTEKAIAFLYTSIDHVGTKLKTHNIIYNCSKEKEILMY